MGPVKREIVTLQCFFCLWIAAWELLWILSQNSRFTQNHSEHVEVALMNCKWCKLLQCLSSDVVVTYSWTKRWHMCRYVSWESLSLFNRHRQHSLAVGNIILLQSIGCLDNVTSKPDSLHCHVGANCTATLVTMFPCRRQEDSQSFCRSWWPKWVGNCLVIQGSHAGPQEIRAFFLSITALRILWLDACGHSGIFWLWFCWQGNVSMLLWIQDWCNQTNVCVTVTVLMTSNAEFGQCQVNFTESATTGLHSNDTALSQSV